MTNGIKDTSARQAVSAILLGMALAVAPLALAACEPQTENNQADTGDGQTGKANKDEIGGRSGSNGSDGVGGESSGSGSSTASGGGTSTTSDGSSHSKDDFYGGSGLYGTNAMMQTNDYSFEKDGVGTWRLDALMEGDGTILDGNSISSATLELAKGGQGTLNTDAGDRTIIWSQYKDFPQMAMGTFDDTYVVTMEINDAGKLTVKQDVDGDIMLFTKTNAM